MIDMTVNQNENRTAPLREIAGRSVYMIPAAVCIYDVNLRKPVYVNREYTEITGYTEASLKPLTEEAFLSKIHFEDLFGYINRFKAVARDVGLAAHKMSYRLKSSQGEWIWCLSRLQVMERDENGDPFKAIEVFFDCTREKEQEFRLIQLREAVSEAAIVAETDSHGVITHVNDKFCEISGYGAGELLGQTHSIVNSGFHPPKFFKEMWQAISTGHVWQGEIKNRAKNGSFYWVSTTIVPFFDSDGKVAKYISIRYPLTKEKRLQEQLNHQQEVTDVVLKSSHLKSRFISELSHEVRGYLNCIVGFADILGDSANKENHEYLDRIKGAAREILHTMNVVLDAVRLDNAKVVLNEEAFSLHDVIADTSQLAKVLANEKKLAMKVDVGADVPKTVVADSHRLSQVILNLLTNAVKYTDEGKVNFEVRLEKREGDVATVQFAVSDTGRGMSGPQLNNLFKEFEQCSLKDSRYGSGLGLVITRRLVDLMGGHVWLESQPGVGTTAFVSLPFKVP